MTENIQSTPRRKLGDVLRDRIEAQAQQTIDGDRAKADEAGRVAVANLAEVTAFFASVKARLEQGINEGKTKHEVQLGTSDSKNENGKIRSLLLSNQSEQNLQKQLERPSHPYHGTWKDFIDWAADEKLSVKVDYRYDSGGFHSWHTLVIQPSIEPAAKPRSRRSP